MAHAKFDLVGFTGPAGSGKTTAAAIVCERLKFKPLSFAEPIRDMLKGLGLNQRQLTEEKNTPLHWLGGKTPRQLMQTLGTEWGRTLVDPEIWTLRVRCMIESRRLVGSYYGTVIDDVRFDDEAKLIRAMGGVVIAIDRGGLPKMTHASEAGVSPDLIDLRITNVENAPECLKDWVRANLEAA